MNSTVIKLFAENAPKYGLGNLAVEDLNLNEIRYYLKRFIAELFVEVVQCDKNEDNTTLEKELVVCELVSAAGFEISHVVFKKTLHGNYLDQDGVKTGEVYKINKKCPYVVIDKNNNDYYFATGWLDCAWRVAKDNNIKRLKEEIERSIHFAPIIIAPEGDTVVEFPPRPTDLARYEYFVDHKQDLSELEFLSIGLHNYCGGAIERIRISGDFSTLTCRKCCLRVPIPAKIKTYGELRQHMFNEI